MKTQEKILSIVIPAYNIGDYIEDCIISIEKNADTSQFEIVVVDDGSTDDTVQCVSKLQERYSNIQLVTQSNSGVSAARNRGIDMATGKFIWFVDGDDYLADGTVSYILDELIKSDGLKILTIDLMGVDENTHTYQCKRNLKSVVVKYEPPAGPWCVILNRCIAEELRFDSQLAYGEDYFWTFLLKKYYKQSVKMSPAVYCYRKRSTSAMNSKSKDAIIKRIDSFIKLYEKYCELEIQNKTSDYKYNELSRRKRQCTQGCLLTLFSYDGDSKFILDVLQRLKNNKMYPYFPILENLIPKRDFKSYRINLISFLFPWEWYFLLLIRLIKKRRER